MRSVLRIIKPARNEHLKDLKAVKNAKTVQQRAREIESTVKDWIVESRQRRRAADHWQNDNQWQWTGKSASGKMARIAKSKAAVLIVAGCLVASALTSFAKSKGGEVPKPSASGSGNSEVDEHFITVESLRVHYIEGGTGRTVVMIHGNAGGVEDFEFGVVDLLSRQYRVVAIDRPGHGRSDRPAGRAATVEYQAQLLHQTLLRLGITQPILVGHSWGSALALAYALKYPNDVSAMVLLAPAAYPNSGANRLLRMTIKAPVVGDLSLLLGKSIMGHRMLKRDLARAFYPKAVPDDYLKVASSSWLGRKQLKAYLEDEWALNDSLKEMSTRYSEIHTPVVIVTGDEDKIVSPQQNAHRLHAAIPQSRMVELKETGHQIPVTDPDSIYAALMLISQS